MQAGKLRHKIIIQENQSASRDAVGAQVDNWIDIITCRASIEPLSGREYFVAAQMQAEVTTRFRIRHPRQQIWPGMRIKYYDYVLLAYRYFDILSVIDQNEMHVDLWLMTVESVTKEN